MQQRNIGGRKMTNDNKYIGYIGTYTKGTSKGIYSFQLEPESNTISEPTLVAELVDPSYLTISKDQKHLYSIYKADGKGAVASFAINQQTGELSLIGKSISPNDSYCHLTIDNDVKSLVTASYGGGFVESFSILEDGSVSSVQSTVRHEGKGPNLDRQEKAHAHFATFTPDEKFIAVVDLGIDQIITYRLENKTLQKVNSLAVTPGSGPRHLIFHPTQPFAYVIAELRPEVIVLAYDKESGSFEILQTIRSVPEDFVANNQGSAIHISSDGHYVYAGNRGHDSIAVFVVDERTGKLSLVQIISTEGHWPRDFSLDPTENFLVASNEESGNLTLYKRDQQSGELTLLQAGIQVPYPICIKFLRM
jgi:6-phosphogluconolactonase